MNENEVDRYSPIDVNNPPNLIDIVNKRYEAGKVWANASAVYGSFERKSDIKLARIMQRIRENTPIPEGKRTWTRDDLKDMARADKEWEEFVGHWDDAHQQMMDALNEKTTWDQALDAVRTESVNARELSKIR